MLEARQIRSANGRGHAAPNAAMNGNGGADRRNRHLLLRRSPRHSFDLGVDGAFRIRRCRRVSDSFSAIPRLARHGAE